MATGPTNAGALPVSQNQTVPESPTTHKVIFIDPFGVVNEQWVENGTNAIVPTPRVHEYLTFVEWNQSTENVTEDRVIGAIYDTTDGKTHAFASFNANTGLYLVLYFNKSDTSTLVVDWGDGTQSSFTNSGSFNTGGHNYTNYGEYEIKIWISNGSGTYLLGGGGSSTSFWGGSNQDIKNTLKGIFLGNNIIEIQKNQHLNNRNLKYISIPKNVTILRDSSLAYCFLLNFLCLPKYVVTIERCAIQLGRSLLQISFSNSLTTIGDSSLDSLYSLSSICFTKSTNSIGNYSLQYAYSIRKIQFPSSLVNLTQTKTFAYCYALEKIFFSSSLLNLGSQVFYDLTSVLQYVFLSTNPPILGSSSAFYNINPLCKIYVPDASLTAYKTATNWSTYANYIYPLSDLGE